MSLKLLVKSLLHSFFFTDHLRHKTANKTTCRNTSANPHHLCAHVRSSRAKVFCKIGVLRNFEL